MIKREKYLSRIRGFYHKDLIKVISGIRRCGKSILLTQIIDELKEQGISEKQIIYINFEDYDYSFIKTGNDFHEYVKDRILINEKNYLFFDEIQVIQEFERVINSLKVKYDTSIFITGSNGKLLSGELATFLAGRYVSFSLYPFSFSELCELKKIDKSKVTDEILYEYMIWGGLPQRFSLESEEQTKTFLRDVYDAIVLRDIIQRAGVKDVELFGRIIEYLVCNPSQLFSPQSMSDYFLSINRKVSKETIYNYLEHITTSLIMSKVSRYDIRGKRILTKLDKYYLTDMGLGRIRNSGFKLEMGALLENVVYNELLSRGYDVYVGKTRNGEIDFVTIKDNLKEYYQVAYYLYDENVIEREFGAFNNVPDNYPKYVLSFDKMDFSRDGIIHKNILDFLLDNKY
ncbi:MAG: ATP-binding protein [Lachnospiraceae bacterium]|nr:ATP-binding protein [Lachnospiraceae bacterium]